MKTTEELKQYLKETGMYSWNGVLDDFVFGKGDEWYYIEPSPYPFGRDRYVGPFATYDEANDHERKST